MSTKTELYYIAIAATEELHRTLTGQYDAYIKAFMEAGQTISLERAYQQAHDEINPKVEVNKALQKARSAAVATGDMVIILTIKHIAQLCNDYQHNDPWLLEMVGSAVRTITNRLDADYALSL